MFRGPLSTRDRSLSSFYSQGIPFPVVLFIPFTIRTIHPPDRLLQTLQNRSPRLPPPPHPSTHTQRTVLYELPIPSRPPTVDSFCIRSRNVCTQTIRTGTVCSFVSIYLCLLALSVSLSVCLSACQSFFSLSVCLSLSVFLAVSPSPSFEYSC